MVVKFCNLNDEAWVRMRLVDSLLYPIARRWLSTSLGLTAG
ncbi:hypothetical protein QUA86_18860 [Microcoleus sp. F6_B6]